MKRSTSINALLPFVCSVLAVVTAFFLVRDAEKRQPSVGTASKQPAKVEQLRQGTNQSESDQTSESMVVEPSRKRQLFPKGYTGYLETCPQGSTSAGSGYCRADSPDDQFIPTGTVGNLQVCPEGTTAVGSGYCRIDE